jgi:hypothetical protein
MRREIPRRAWLTTEQLLDALDAGLRAKLAA